ncbi:hypothetical protein GQ42DRAFT_165805 [Ramicandelaber brevisporus]|nr:hypothetical protein GQ42DRAFT_165805 [Ramicandelaber brevisporus]
MFDLEGSCQCGAIAFKASTMEAVPFEHCYCSICRKMNGAGCAAWVGCYEKDFTLLRGADYVKDYRAVKNPEASKDKQELFPLVRSFCKDCGSSLWLKHYQNPRGRVVLSASIIDTELPVPKQRVHIYIDSAMKWADPRNLPAAGEDLYYSGDPDLTVEQYNEKHGYSF